MNSQYVQFGCGFNVPSEWLNFDNSPSIKIQKIPLFGSLLKNILRTSYPTNVLFGDIVKGLPIKDNSCLAVYSSHTLEHLSLIDFRIALKNSYKILKKDGIFRCVVPDLEYAAHCYINDLKSGDPLASIKFLGDATLLGHYHSTNKGIRDFIISFMGVSFKHLWMWDFYSLSEELKNAGFKNIRRAEFNDSNIPQFKLVEDIERFKNSVAIECSK